MPHRSLCNIALGPVKQEVASGKGNYASTWSLYFININDSVCVAENTKIERGLFISIRPDINSK